MRSREEVIARLKTLEQAFAEADGPNSEVFAIQITELEWVLGIRDCEASA